MERAGLRLRHNHGKAGFKIWDGLDWRGIAAFVGLDRDVVLEWIGARVFGGCTQRFPWGLQLGITMGIAMGATYEG
ncbi:hypothetical protein CHH75_16645 [Paenibacillus sp. 7541]|nr:hypothetical protein CHH75_16645 [Paenibacillus sp. 7541]